MPQVISYFHFFLFTLASFCLNAQEGGSLVVDFGVKDGRIIIVNAQFESELKYPTDTKKQLVNLINKGFYQLDSIIRKGEMQWCLPASKICYPLEEYVEDYLIFTEMDGQGGNIVDNYFENFDTWGPDELLEEFLFDVLQIQVLNGSPLTLTEQGFEEEDYESLSFTFPVKPPIDLQQINIIDFNKDTLTTTSKRRILKDLDGQLFFESSIREKLDIYYALLKFQVAYFIRPTEIRILPYKINRFIVRTSKNKLIDRFAYLTLAPDLYKTFFKLNKDSIKLEAGNNAFIYQFNLLKHYNGNTAQLPILLSNELPLLQAQLNKQFHTLNILPTLNDLLEGIPINEQELYKDFIIQALDKEADSTNIAPATPNLATLNHSSETNNENFTSSTDANKTATLTDFRRNFIGLGIDYNLNDATRLKLIYRRLLPDNSNLSLQLAYAFNEMGFSEGGLALSGSYAKDYLWFNALKKRLFLRLSAQSDFTANRVLLGEALKERRTGAKMYIEIDWFRNLTKTLFQSTLNISDQQIKLENFEEIEYSSNNIFSTEWRNLFYHATPFKLLNTQIKLENKLAVGWLDIGDSNAATFFHKGGFDLNLNQQLLGGLALDLTAYAEWNSQKTPIFEQIGHQVARNRGFKQDVLIARNLIGGTLEFWMPLARFRNNASGIRRFLYQHLRLALFCDFSRYMNLIDQGQATTLWSPGLGLRFLKLPAQINFDWAFGQTNAGFFHKNNQFSLNLVINSPFQ